VTVFTSPAKVTREALRGEDGALRASRIRQADGSTIDLEAREEEPEVEDEPAPEETAPPRPF
jgi:hypothetical protein